MLDTFWIFGGFLGMAASMRLAVRGGLGWVSLGIFAVSLLSLGLGLAGTLASRTEVDYQKCLDAGQTSWNFIETEKGLCKYIDASGTLRWAE